MFISFVQFLIFWLPNRLYNLCRCWTGKQTQQYGNRSHTIWTRVAEARANPWRKITQPEVTAYSQRNHSACNLCTLQLQLPEICIVRSAQPFANITANLHHKRMHARMHAVSPASCTVAIACVWLRLIAHLQCNCTPAKPGIKPIQWKSLQSRCVYEN